MANPISRPPSQPLLFLPSLLLLLLRRHLLLLRLLLLHTHPPPSPPRPPPPPPNRYANAEDVFRKIDRLIRAVHEEGVITARYSTPQEYVEAKRQESTTLWPLKDATDFFPYADSPHKVCTGYSTPNPNPNSHPNSNPTPTPNPNPNQVWSGYFTSRPALKGYIRTSSATFSAARMLHALASAAKLASDDAAPRAPAPLRLLEEALAVSSHHDAITGTP